MGRGRDEPQASYLLLHDDLPDVVIMSEQERNLWGLCTGENSVESICQQYLIHRRDVDPAVPLYNGQAAVGCRLFGV